MFKVVGIILLLVILAVGVSFSSMNLAPVSIHYYFGSQDMPLVLALIIALAAGVIIGALGTLSALLKQKRQISKLNRQIKSKDGELAHLRAVPVVKEGV